MNRFEEQRRKNFSTMCQVIALYGKSKSEQGIIKFFIDQNKIWADIK